MRHGQIGFNEQSIAVQITEHWYERMAGLLALPKLKTAEGLLIKPCNSVHSIAMSYSLDLVYLNKHQQIIKLVSALKPWRMSFCLQASAVLELPAGTIAQLGLSLGQTGIET